MAITIAEQARDGYGTSGFFADVPQRPKIVPKRPGVLWQTTCSSRQSAIRESGLDLYEIAELASADPRTVQRWLGGRTPHPRYRHKLAAALGSTPAQLWPDATSVRRQSDADEIAGAWRRSDAADVPDWRALLRSASHHVDLLGYSLSDILSARGIAKQLAAKHADGCKVRIAIADPNDDHVRAADLNQRPTGVLLGRVQASQDRLRALVSDAGIDGRVHRVATSHTILRFDDDLLLTIHLHASPGPGAPVIHLRRGQDYGIFDQLTNHFEDVWTGARAITPDAVTQPEADQTAAQLSRDQLLDDLDYVWRPGQ